MCPEQDAEQDSAAEIVPPVTPKAPWRVRSAKPAGLWRLNVVFNDGLSGNADLHALIHSPHAGVFSALRDIDIFGKVRVMYGAVTWPGDIDLAPEPMYEAIKTDGIYVPGPHESDASLKRA